MYKILSIIFLFGVQNALAQVTPNPKVTKKSTQDTFINKIEITDDYTVVSMQYVSKSPKEALKEYLDNNPKEKEQLGRMNPMMRNMLLQQMMGGMGGSTISIQPTSFLRSKDGKEFDFIKASNIPVAPERQNVEPDKKYFFKVFFEKLSPGIKSVDLVEGPNDERDGFQYWNFYGVEVNNPALGETQALAAIPENPAEEFIMSGKVYDAATEKPIAAKITCTIEGDNVPFDSVMTSRTGYYEFLVKPDSYVYKIEADGYALTTENMNLSKVTKSFDRDIFLEPLVEETPQEEIAEVIEEPVKEEELEEVDENTFRLKNVYFPLGKADILEESHKELAKVVRMMNENPEMEIRVDGHTDNQGDSRLNMILSMDRAKNVRDYLIAEGIEAKRITFKGWGDTKPIEKNQSKEERQKNRRVEIVIINE
ncbi:OmpA family protein [uncultured Arcticibacterium sp.]|uniref:OmpA family protein n=1 Tax=uncultured Arcticibacterium sp. TaxID=2173042 RepID=UPI0030F73755